MAQISADLEVSERNLRDQGESENAIVPDSDRLSRERSDTVPSESTDIASSHRKRRLDHHYPVWPIFVHDDALRRRALTDLTVIAFK